ncbi:hypothetical protein, partial [Propionibacterium freudenreichii]|uniref:hypothetical protein n=1 Tax=Propionibacterium freudenreichii TaxID=1744 RepID=UPI003853B45F
SATTSLGRCSKPADSDPRYTLVREEPPMASADWVGEVTAGVEELPLERAVVVLPPVDPHAVSSRGAVTATARSRWMRFMVGFLQVGGLPVFGNLSGS